MNILPNGASSTLRLSGLYITEEEHKRLAGLQAEISGLNRINPNLRLRLPQRSPFSTDLKLCCDYYWKYRDLCYEEDSASKVADFLASFQHDHPLEWE